jgi:4a-hydroxytetrahydrobiopterin dehydratase
MTVLSDDQIDQWVSAHEGWRRVGGVLTKTIECATFPDAIALVTAVGEAAEQRAHHPDMYVRYRTLRFSLATHSEGGITGKDIDLAGAIDELAARHSG